MYSLHDVKITGVALDRILFCEIESHTGEHSTLMLGGYVDNAEEFLFCVPDCQDIEVSIQDKEGTKILFSGIVSNIRITDTGQMKTVWIEGKSRSWLMDRTKRSRSFQDAQTTYQALVEEILKDYEGSSLIYAGESLQTGALIIQYEETDWAFLKRVLSKTGLVLTPDSRAPGISLYAGVPAFPESTLIYSVLEMNKDMRSYYRLKANQRMVHPADFTQYVIASEQLMGIFETALVQGQPLAAYAYRYSFDAQELTGTYWMQSQKGLSVQASYPMHLIGAALMAKVVEVKKNLIRAAMEIDGTHTERAAVSGYEAPQGGSDRMQDPDSRYLRTRFGQELALNPNEASLSCGGMSGIRILSDGSLNIYAKETVCVQASEKITLHAEENLTIHVKEQFQMQSMQGGQLTAMEGKIFIRGTEVKLD